jgi:hypothetical protein
MRSSVVEGEPGIFPDPVARVLRGLGRLFSRHDRSEAADETEPPKGSASDD